MVALASLRREVESVGPLLDEELELPHCGRRLTVLRPTNIDLLLDGAADDPEQQLPYWAEVWPSGLALADAIFTKPEMVRGRRVLELGCGLGITAAAALLAGSELVAADYAPEALLLCRYNTRRNAGREPATLRLNWRRPDPQVFAIAPGGFQVVLAADVLYEQRDVEPLLALVDRLVAPTGCLWLAEPGRAPARAFIDRARGAGWDGPSTPHTGPWPDPRDARVVVGVHELRRRLV